MTETYRVLHDDGQLLVVDKAAGVLTVGHGQGKQRCLLDDLRRDGHKVAPVHRLDRETSGALLLCLDPDLRGELEGLFRGREVRKTYLALVEGRLPSRKGTVDVPILDQGATAKVDRRGKRAVTHFEVLESHAAGTSLVRVRIDTGRHNQIRVHMAHVGCPLLGDRKFGRRRRASEPDGRRGAPDLPRPRRTLLHAERLALPHPATGETLDVSCEPPADFTETLEALRATGPAPGASPRKGSRGSPRSTPRKRRRGR